MQSGDRRASGVMGLVGPGLLAPGVAAVDSLEPTAIVGSPWLRAVVVFVLVVPFGAGMLVRYRGVVDRGLDASTESPAVSVVYGVLAHIGILFAAGVFSTQLANAGLDQQTLAVGSTLVLGAVLLTLGGLGFAVLGTWLVDLRGEGKRWHGLVAVSALGAGGWLLPTLAGLAVWTLLVSVGIGGATRKWIHAERSVEAELEE